MRLVLLRICCKNIKNYQDCEKQGMNQQERKHFWEVLCSLQGRDLESESEELEKTIKPVRYLYRYRAVSLRTIDALQQNHMYFSKANYYDDPFDTLLHINFSRIRDEGLKVLSSDQFRQQIKSLSSIETMDSKYIESLISFLDSAGYEKIVEAAIGYLKQNIQSVLKETLWTACFTESGDNETMWLKYANQYKGFCLIYDLQDSSLDLCGKQEKCLNCVVNKAGVSIYPVYYSNEGYDATEYAKSLMTYFLTQFLVSNNHLPIEIVNAIVPSIQSQMWQPERITLIKSKCHEYDREWRMMLRNLSAPPVMKEWIPSGVILGLRVDDSDKSVIIKSSKMAGINHIYESFINDEYKLAHREIVC